MPAPIELEETTIAALGHDRFSAAPLDRHRPNVPPDAQPILSIRASVPRAEVSKFIATALRDIRTFMQEHHLSAAGPPFSVCRPDDGRVDVEACYPTTTQAATGGSRIHSGLVPRSLAGPR